MRRRPRWTGLLLAALLVATVLSPAVWQLRAVPRYVALTEDQGTALRVPVPPGARFRLDRTDVVRVRDGGRGGLGGAALSLEPLRSGRAHLELTLFGLIPFRRVAVDVLPPIRVVPGGHSIGVVVGEQGLRVAALAPVAGGRRAPAQEAGLRVGDVIVGIDGRPVASVGEAVALIHRAGEADRPVRLAVRRGRRTLEIRVRPLRDPMTGRFLIGIWIREATVGVGTLTFYEPRTRTFAALGHVIVDRDGRTPLSVEGGRIVPAAVIDVHRGQRGVPGEKVGRFDPDEPPLGVITRNTEYGIAGILDRLPEPRLPAVPIGLLAHVRPGPAQILTVVRGHRPERFDVVVERVLGNHRGGKNMIIRVTDPRLLALTGGIVQGMSGSPVLQGGRLVGAVTHVFVHDPTRGYAVSAEWMVLASGLLDRLRAQQEPARAGAGR